MPKITLVIPVFNAISYLPNLFENLEKQDFTDFLCLFVYDNSTDETLSRLQFLQSKFANIQGKVLVKPKKEGVGKARDFAIDSGLIASKYVLFLDSDDAFSPFFLSTLFAKAESTGADITMCGYQRIQESAGRVISREMINNPDEINDLSTCDVIPYLNPAPWNKLYRFDVIKDCRFIFSGGGEDEMFFLKVLPNCRKIAFVNETLYDYHLHSGSILANTDNKLYEESLNGYKEVKNFYFSKAGRYLEFIPILEASVFVRFGIGMTTRTCLCVPKKRASIIKTSRSFLDANFSGWKKNKFLSFHRCFKRGFKTLLIWRCRFLYKINCFCLFVFDYAFFTKYFKKDIKW